MFTHEVLDTILIGTVYTYTYQVLGVRLQNINKLKFLYICKHRQACGNYAGIILSIIGRETHQA